MKRDDPLIAAAIREVHDLHDAFVPWFTGAIPKDEASFRRIDEALGEEFVIVPPGGERRDRRALMDWFWKAHGTRNDTARPFHIWIENEEPVFVGNGVVALGYDECQDGPEGASRRRSTVLFRADPSGPNGLRWVTVHETWVSPPKM